MKPDQAPSLEKARAIADGVFVEIGTWEGDFSYALLKHTKCKKVYCIDPYKHFEDDSYPDGMNSLSQEQFDKKYETVRARFAEFGDRVEFLRMSSVDAAVRFADESVDFVYIDGNHDYSFVLLDIMTWWPKVRVGGWLTGDDVYSTDLAEHDADGNITKHWFANCWGKYGTYKAIVDAAAIFSPANISNEHFGSPFEIDSPDLMPVSNVRRSKFKFTIDQTQFLVHKE